MGDFNEDQEVEVAQRDLKKRKWVPFSWLKLTP